MAIPRPTLADIDLPPRRRLRDGSRSTTSSRSSSVSSSLSSLPIRPTTTRARGGRGRSVSTLSTLSTSSGSVISRRSGLRNRTTQPEPEEEYEYGMNANGNEDEHENVDNGSNVNHGSTLIDMLDIDRPVPTEAGDEADRRYTAAEKGKGRAGRVRTGEKETITIDDEDEEEDSIQITGMKRKAVVESEEEEEGGDEDETRLGAFTCPVCFSEPTDAVVTTCGHILCSDCLFSCLIAAINRNPNPHAPPPPKPKTKRGKKGKKRRPDPQPTEWTAAGLQEHCQYYRDIKFERVARDAGMDEVDIEAGRDRSEISVERMTKGLWKVDGDYVVEGDCPVCRKGLPGGYGPVDKGIGSVIPVEISVGVGWKSGG